MNRLEPAIQAGRNGDEGRVDIRWQIGLEREGDAENARRILPRPSGRPALIVDRQPETGAFVGWWSVNEGQDGLSC